MNRLTLLMALCLGFFLCISCEKEETSTPNGPIGDPKIASILDLRELALDGKNTITENYVITAVVTLSPENGQIEQQSFIIQDGTSGLTVNVNSNHNYKVGQKVEIYAYAGNIDKTTVGNMELSLTADSKITVIEENAELPEPIELSIEVLLAGGHEDERIVIKSVQFEAEEGSYSDGNHRIISCDNQAIASVYVRDEASFADESIPHGNGSFIGIAVKRMVPQILVSASDLLNDMDGNRCDVEEGPEDGDGSLDAPYNVKQVLLSDMDGSTQWVHGYIVGAAINSPMTPDDPTSYSFAVPYGKNTNILISDRPDETDITRCIPVELTASFRPLISIEDNPEFKNRKITVEADLIRYYQVNGLKALKQYTFTEETIVLNSTKMNFGQVDDNEVSESQAITIIPYQINGDITITAPTQFEVSLSADNGYETSVSFAATTDERTTAYFRFAPDGSIQGDVELDFEIAGGDQIRLVEAYGFAGDGDPKGSENNPYSVAEVRDNQGIGYAWGEGYIVGIPDDGPVYYWEPVNGEWLHTKGLILAASPSERDPANVILIRLTGDTDTDIRDEVNLKDNPSLYGKKIKFGGSINTYYGIPGIIEIDGYSLVD